MTSAYVLTGIDVDVASFLFKFVNMKKHTYGTFSEVWKEMQFYYIFSGRPTLLEMKYVVKELLLIVKSHALPPYSSLERTGAIFLLFTLYNLQPLSKKIPIRIEKDEWSKLCTFSEEMKAVNLEVPFCFFKLLVSHAFDFVFTNKPYTMESLKDDDHPKLETQSTQSPKKYKYDKFAMGNLLTSIGYDPRSSSETESRYNDIKQTLNEKFPGLCNFEQRRFAVKLITPQTNQPKPVETTEGASCSAKGNEKSCKKGGKKPGKKKSLMTDLLLFSNDEELIDSTLSMPSISANMEVSDQDSEE